MFLQNNPQGIREFIIELLLPRRYFASLIFLALLLLVLPACTGMFYYPNKEQVLSPEELNLSYEDIYIKSFDGTRLHAWYLPSISPSKGTVFFLHGNAENISTHIGSVYWLPEQGFNVLLFEYRGYGASEGRPSIEAMHRDIEVALGEILSKPHVAEDGVVLFGQSLGGAMAIYAAAHSVYRASIKAVVAESAFSSYRSVAKEKLSHFFLTDLFKWPLSLTINDSFSPVTSVGELSPIPLLLIHGKKDRIVSVEHADRLFEKAREPKELWKIEGGTHIDALQTDPNRKRFVHFLTECFAEVSSDEAEQNM